MDRCGTGPTDTSNDSCKNMTKIPEIGWKKERKTKFQTDKQECFHNLPEPLDGWMDKITEFGK